MARAEFSMSDLAKDLTVDVYITGMKTFQIRMWIAIKLIQLAAWVLPASVNVHVEGLGDD
jgi:hypothetical protein